MHFLASDVRTTMLEYIWRVDCNFELPVVHDVTRWDWRHDIHVVEQRHARHQHSAESGAECKCYGRKLHGLLHSLWKCLVELCLRLLHRRHHCVIVFARLIRLLYKLHQSTCNDGRLFYKMRTLVVRNDIIGTHDGRIGFDLYLRKRCL